MILYSATKTDFSHDVISNQIEQKTLSSFMLRLGRTVGVSEVNSWKNSLMYMQNVLSDVEIPSDANVAVEYKLPNTSKRIDFILCGQNASHQDSMLIVELKQWTELVKTDKDAIVCTRIGGAEREVPHP
jgi:hypothetical protein